MTDRDHFSTPKTPSLTQILAIAFPLVAIISIILISVLQIRAILQAERNAIASQQQLITSQAAHEVTHFIELSFTQLESTTLVNHTFLSSLDGQKNLIRHLLGTQPAIQEVAWLDQHGQESAKISRLETFSDDDLIEHKESELFVAVKEGNRYYSPISIDEVTREPMITIAAPIISELDDFEGVIVAEINLKFMWRLMRELEFGETGITYVVNDQGDLIAFADTSRVLKGENLSNLDSVAAFMEDQPPEAELAVQTVTGIEGERVLTTYFPLDTPEWAVITEISVEEAYRGVVANIILSIGWTVLAAVLASAVSLFLARQITNSLLRLTKIATQIAGGDLTLKAERGGHAEVDQLAAAFNGMTSQLVQSIESLEQEIKERKQAEAEKLELEAHLRQGQKLESIGTLASGVAHEINNPIMGIMNYAQLIGERLDPSQKRLREFSTEIIRETKRVAEIVRNLLTFARQDKQSHSLAQISDIVTDTLSLIRTVIKRDQIMLEVDVPEGLPKINCRSQQIQQVLMNLLTNARDALNGRYPNYDPNKIIFLTVRPFEKDGRRWLRTTVEDHGTGIPFEIRERIFDPFYTTKSRAMGTGLGLSIGLGIVQDHHGKLTFESVENQFTRFYLDLLVDNDWLLGETFEA